MFSYLFIYSRHSEKLMLKFTHLLLTAARERKTRVSWPDVAGCMSSRAVAASCMGLVSVEAPRAGQGSCSGLSMGLLVYAPRWPLLASSRPLLSALHTTASVIFNMHIRLFPETPFRCPPPVLRVQSKPFPHCLAFRTPHCSSPLCSNNVLFTVWRC